MADETKPAVGEELDEELDRALARLPAHAAPPALRRRLEALVAAEATPAAADGPARIDRRRPRAGTLAASFVSACAAAALVLVATRVGPPRPIAGGGAPSELVAEAVNDHIRVISSTHFVDIESGGIH